MSLMTIEDMQGFVDKVSDKKVLVKKVEEELLEPFAGLTYVDDNGCPTIEVSDAIYENLKGSKSSKSFIKAFLLHELGHLNVPEEKLPYKNEYNAHMWGIKKSQELNLKRVTMSLREEIIYWHNLEDTDSFRKYRKASEMYMDKQGFVL